MIPNSNVRKLYVQCDGPLLQVPIGALVEENSDIKDFSELKYLIYSKSINYIFDIVDIVKRDTHLHSNKEDRLIVFGYSDKNTITQANDTKFPELPGAIKEINALKKAGLVLPENIYVGKNCTKENFLKTLPYADILHVATHATSNGMVRDLNRVIFKSTNGEVASGTVILNAEEIGALDLKARLVFLSACETGMGKVYNGEGTYNLGRTFLSAGAEKVIQSYWQLDDFSASQIVEGFYYHYYNGFSVSESLRLSKLHFLKEWPAKSQPFFWSGVN